MTGRRARERTVPVDRLRVILVLAAHGLHLRRLGEEAGISHPGALRALRVGRLQPRLISMISDRTKVDAGFIVGGASFTDKNFMQCLRSQADLGRC
jgi:hypothetical protein